METSLAFPISTEIIEELRILLAENDNVGFIKIWIAEDVAEKPLYDFQRGYISGIECKLQVVKRIDIWGRPYQINLYPNIEKV